MKRLLLSLLIPALAYNGYSQSVTLDSEWDTTVKINTATTDQDFIVQDGTVDLTLLNFTDATTLTASTGAVTATQVLHIIAAETGTADTIDTISGGATGDILIVRPDTGDTITFADGTAGGDNLDFAGQDVVLDSVNERLVLEYNGTNWVIVAVSPFVMGVTDIIFEDADVAVSSVGELDYDNTITGLDDGGLTWYDDDEVRTLIDLDASEGTLESGDDGHIVTYNWNSGSGYFDLQASSGGGVSVEDRTTTEQDIVNTDAETTLYSYTIGAGDLSTDKTLETLIVGDILQNNGSQSFIIRVKLGGTTLYEDTTSAVSASATRYPFTIRARVSALGSTSSQWVSGEIVVPSPSATTGLGDANTDEGRIFAAFANSASEDSTGSLAFEVTIDWTNASANQSFRRKYAKATLY